MPRDPDGFELDPVDRGIVTLLQRNGRVANLEIARQLGLAEATVRKRMERLLEEGIVRVGAVVSPAAVGHPVRALIGIRAELPHVQELARQVSALPQARSVSLTAGAYDLVLEVACQSQQALEELVMGRLAALPGIVRTETYHVFRTVKEAADWRIPEGKMESRPETSKRVLVIDDDPSFRTICRAILTKSGYAVATAVDGADGMAKARQEKPDLIILDFMMSSPMEGQEVIWNVREDPELQRVPVIMMTSVGSKHPLWKVHPTDEELPVDDWLDKPVAPDRLLAAVAKALGKPGGASSA